MKVRRTKSTAFAAAVLAGLSVSLAAEPAAVSTAPAVDDVQAQLREMRAKIEQLEQQQKAKSDAALGAVLDDAQRRSKLAVDGESITSGYDKGFFIQNADKSFTLRPFFSVQVRNVTNYIEEGQADGDDEIQNGWEIRRLKFGASGNAYGPNVTYGFQLTNNRNSANIELDDVWVQWKFATHVAVKAGQYKGPFNREELISDPTQTAVERSLLNELLGGGVTGPRSQGVSLIYGAGGTDLGDDPLRIEVMFNDGDGTPNTDFRDDVGTPDSRPDWGVIGRVDYKVFGKWSDWNKVSAKGNAEDLLVLGGAVSVSGNTGANATRYTVDAQYQAGAKLSVFGAVIGRTIEPYGDGDALNDLGGIVQVGYLVAPNWEPFVRADVTAFDSDAPPAGGGGEDTFSEFAVGVTYYFGEDGKAFNRAKLTFDLNYLPHGTPGDRTGLGYLSSDGEAEFVLRGQFQFWL
jgi:hypothetical protein